MLAKNIILYKQEIPLKTPFKTALRCVSTLESIIIEIQTENGITGYGSASPTAAITGETIPSIFYAITDYIFPAIKNKVIDSSVFKIISNSIEHNTSAKSAVETAIYDLLSKNAGLPLFQYLGGKDIKKLDNDITISLNDPDIMYSDAITAKKNGINIFKIKLGGSSDEDIRRINAVSKATGDSKLRLDANQAWDFNTAYEIIDYCVSRNLSVEFIEQPFKAHQIKLMSELKHLSKIPILADESVFNSSDAEDIVAKDAADYINIKLAKCGGLTDAIKICNIAKAANKQCLIGCMLESPIGIIAAAHLATAFDIISMHDLDVVELIKYNPIISDVQFYPNSITVGTNTGLGVNNISEVIRFIG
ncbi:MAG: hypothetical protein A2Y17_03175 [Clostridiales bacterium GWF2_38_85]|nr:MAG: hypothetical protein A2Y17_03175 [Clostridiales bacterium GWF2_38_85]